MKNRRLFLMQAWPNIMMKKSLFAIVAALFVAVPAQATSLQVTSGLIVREGTFWQWSLFGDGFWATGSSNLACSSWSSAGSPINTCTGTDYFVGKGTGVVNGVSLSSLYFDSIVGISAPPMYLSGQTQATLTQQVSYSNGFYSCAGLPAPCGTGNYMFSLEGTVGLLTIDLLQNAAGGYDTLHEIFTIGTPIATPEPLTLPLLSLGAIALGWRRRRSSSPRP